MSARALALLRGGRVPAHGAWHVDAATGARYARGALPELAVWSVEKHIEACSGCAALVSEAVRGTAAAAELARVRTALLTAIGGQAPRPVTAARETGQATRAERGPAGVRAAHPRRWFSVTAGRRIGRVAWAAGPALRGPWIVALLLVCTVALGLARGGGALGVRPVLLTLAPVLPLLGVALSYGPGADPMYEITAATPSGGLRLLLTRTAAVLGVSLPSLTAAGAFLPGPPGAPGAAAWLLPGLALTLGALALGSYTGCRVATAAVAACWVCAVVLPALASHGAPEPGATAGTAGDGVVPVSALAGQLAHLLSGTAVQGGWAAAGLLCAGLLALRRDAFDFAPGSGPGRPHSRLEIS